MSEITITKENFDQEVMKSDKPILLDFWATWCGPCQMLAPVVEEIAKAHPEIKVGKVNVDEQPDLADSFSVDSIPLLVYMKNSEVINSSVGYKTKEQIEEMLK